MRNQLHPDRCGLAQDLGLSCKRATVEQIAEATDYSEFVVSTELAAMRAGGFIETLGELHRLDTAKVREGFAMIATHFTQELRAA